MLTRKRKLPASPAKAATQRAPVSGAGRRTMFASMCTTSTAPALKSTRADADSRPSKHRSKATSRAATKTRDAGRCARAPCKFPAMAAIFEDNNEGQIRTHCGDRGNKKRMRMMAQQREIQISEYNSAALDLFGHASVNPYAFAE